MRHSEGNRQQRKGTHLNWEERIQIETLQRVGLSTIEIGERIGRPARTGKNIYTGFVEHRHPGNAESRPAVSISFEVIERLIDAEGFDLLIPTVEVSTWWTSRLCQVETGIELYHDHGTSE